MTKRRSGTILSAAAAVVISVGIIAWQWSVSERRVREIPSKGGTTGYETMADYLRGGATNGEGHPVVFIGLDGATWRVLDPLLRAGELPNLARLRDEGAWGTLRSTACYFSPPAWVTMMSGFDPRNSGIYTFGNWNEQEKRFRLVSSADIAVPMVWDVASAAGKRVAVTNMAVTYPVWPVNGMMVSGLLTPDSFADKRTIRRPHPHAFTGRFDAELDRRAEGARVYYQIPMSVSVVVLAAYDTKDDGVHRYDTLSLKVFDARRPWRPDGGEPLCRFKLGRFSPWFQMDYRRAEGDRRIKRRVACSVKVTGRGANNEVASIELTPLLRLPSDPDISMTYPQAFGKEIEEQFGHYLISLAFGADFIPEFVGETAQFASYFYDYDDWDLFLYTFLAPDNMMHREGDSHRTKLVFQRIDAFLGDLVNRLPEDATLILASDHGFKEYRYIVDLNRYLAECGVLARNGTDYDLERSLVFHDRWCLYLNGERLTQQELEGRGIFVAPGLSPREALIDYLRQKQRGIRAFGRDFPVELVEVPRDGVGNPPDMVVRGGYTDYFVEGSDLDIKSEQIVRKAAKRSSWYHDRDGIYVMWGGRIRRGVNGGWRDIHDVAPTIARLLEIPELEGEDGKAWADLISEDGASVQRAVLKRYDRLIPRPARARKHLESYEKRLRSLGYVQ